MNHKIEFKKRCKMLQETVNFLTENDFHFSLNSDHYIDDEYFNFSNTFCIFAGEIYLEIDKDEEALYIYADNYSAVTGRPEEIIKGIKNIKNYLKNKKGER